MIWLFFKIGVFTGALLLGQGKLIANACRGLCISEATHYKWRKLHGGMSMSQGKRLRRLEVENVRLRRAVADLTLDKQIPQESQEGNLQALSRNVHVC